MTYGGMLLMKMMILKMTRRKMAKVMNPQTKVAQIQGLVLVHITGQGRSLDLDLIQEEDEILGHTLDQTQNHLGHHAQDPDHLGHPQDQGHNEEEAGLGLVPVTRGDGDLGQGHVIVQAPREGVDPGAPTPVPAPGRGHTQEIASIQENNLASSLDGSQEAAFPCSCQAKAPTPLCFCGVHTRSKVII